MPTYSTVKRRENMALELFYEMVAEGFISHARQDIQEGPGVLLQAPLTKRPFSIQNSSNS
jgi:hypothetical protein